MEFGATDILRQEADLWAGGSLRLPHGDQQECAASEYILWFSNLGFQEGKKSADAKLRRQQLKAKLKKNGRFSEKVPLLDYGVSCLPYLQFTWYPYFFYCCLESEKQRKLKGTSTHA